MMCGLIDLNTVNNEDETASPCGSPSSSAASGSLELATASTLPSVSMELWHACAGPLISLPKKGSAVVYFPQGHVEHLPEHPAVAYDLPPHVFCRVVDVKLHADAASDDVYAQVSLIPDQQIEQKWRDGIMESETEDEDSEGMGKSMTPHMFCKTLTASDTSTHGGFSVPRRAAEDCFPPLDYKQQRPSQELVAKDLHGIEWKFRHIYRGQPRRHLLTTGWSAFVNKKKLVSGDAVLFLRGGDGELRLGIRRATQIKTGATILPTNSHQLKASSIAAVVHAISMRSTFDICYNPRLRSSEIIVPYHKFCKSLAQTFSCGMRFKIRFETEDSSERRCSGLIVGVSDVDPARWPGSKWKCLLVRWDDMEVNRLNRVSPWEIELSGPMSGPNSFVLPGTKRNRIGFPAAKPDHPVHRDGNEVSDFGEPMRFQKVLQGQEVFPFSSSYAGAEASRNHLSDMRGYPGLSGFHTGGNSIRQLHADAQNSLERTVVGESFQFRKVLQGQESMSVLSYGRGPQANQVQEKNASNVFNGIQVPRNGNCWSTANQYNASPHLSPSMVRGMSPSSVLLLQQASPQSSQITSLLHGYQNKLESGNHDSSFCVSQRIPKKFALSEIGPKDDLHGFRSSGAPEMHSQTHRPLPTQPLFRDNQNFVSMCQDSCRLFGFPLTEGKNTFGKGDNEDASVSAYGHGSTSLACNEEQLYQPPLVAKVMVSSCTKPSDMHAVLMGLSA
ncbi:Transcriptional factor B3 family protein / auxin-responsive factor AUX/IAA-like protein [Perilla frutescens var. hirtella]|nr:Transcriptional factor B3 family protein / auxin-responsive factor AUX/IAA-like protein [Perilla frutescens var. frutescens]KAH6792959.1 Transcriptional factor B3 family protein / auxin-responsive factor AUX/IAA-like protein [Perilla frutescens var. hirtella]